MAAASVSLEPSRSFLRSREHLLIAVLTPSKAMFRARRLSALLSPFYCRIV
jgi:hypothetical protein